MRTECSATQLEFVGFGRRRVVAGFDAGRVSSDGGLLLLREVAERTRMLRLAFGITGIRTAPSTAWRSSPLNGCWGSRAATRI